MRTQAQEPKVKQQATPTDTAKSVRAEVGHTRSVNSPPVASTFFGHDFSRMPIFSPAPVKLQPKLTISTPGDQHEREAERVADQVMRMSDPQPLPQITAHEGREGEHQAKPCQACGSGPQKPCRSCQSGPQQVAGAPSAVNEVLSSQGQALDADTRSFMEARFGHDFGNVRIHADERAAESAAVVNALAYTVGHNVVFGRGQYAPGKAAGRRLLAHELTHVVQQTGAARPGLGISRTAAVLQRQECPPCIKTSTAHPIDQEVEIKGTKARAVGIVVEMSVDPPTPYRDADFKGVNIFEKVTVGGDCGIPQNQVSNTKAFIVGSANKVPLTGQIFPAKHNVFYDNHLVGFTSSNSSKCSLVRDQTYTCDGADVSTHRITTTFNGSNPPTTDKKDITMCIQEGSGR